MGSTGPREAKKGIVDDIKGKAKEVAGTVIDDDNLRREGEAQRDKAAAAREAAKHEAEADVARMKEEAAEQREQANQHRAR